MRQLTFVIFTMLFSFSLAGCEACAGCTEDEIAGCISDCDMTTCGCDCGECETCECGAGPIPRGFANGTDGRGDRRMRNAAQVRITRQGIDFIEANATELIDAALAEFDADTFPIDSGTETQEILGSGFKFMFCGQNRRAFRVPSAGLFNWSARHTNEHFDADTTGEAMFAVSSGFGTTLGTSFDVFDETANEPRCSGGFLAPNAGDCTFHMEAGHRYRLHVARAGASVDGFGQTTADLFAEPTGGCFVAPQVGAADAPVDLNPDGQFIDARLPVIARSTNSAGDRRPIPLVISERIWPFNFGYQTCQLDIDTTRTSPPGVNINVQAGIGQSPTRPGFGQLAIGDFSVDTGSIQIEDLESDCSVFFGLLEFEDVANLALAFTGDPADRVTGAIGQVKDELVDLCQPALRNPTTGEVNVCPGNSSVGNDGFCYDPSGECVSQLLGVETRLDLSALLESISPGLRASLDVVLAIQDNSQGRSGGYTMPMSAGFDSVTTNACVQELPRDTLAAMGLQAPPSIPLIPQFLGDGDETHVQVGMSERAINWAAYQAWRSGMLCIQVTSQVDQQLATGLFSQFNVVPSLAELLFPEGSVAMGIALRPALPPMLTFGDTTMDEPFVTVDLPQLSIDFYVYASDRFMRIMTYTADVTVGLDVTFDGANLTFGTPAIETNNEEVTNSELLRDDPARLRDNMGTIVGIASGFFELPVLDVTEQLSGGELPIGLDLDERTLRRVSHGGETFIAAYFNLTLPDPAPLRQRVDTTIEVTRQEVHTDGLELGDPGYGARVELAMTAEGPEEVEYEYSYRVNEEAWSEWTRSSYAVLSGGTLQLQAWHDIEARARIVGEPASQDVSPARASVLVDVLPPVVKTVDLGDALTLRTADIVSRPGDLAYRVLTSDGWSQWAPVASVETHIPLPSDEIENIEVRDEAGNIGRVQQSLRGLPPPFAGEGCDDCSATGGAPSRFGWLALFALLLGHRRRRQVGSPSPDC